MNSNGKKVHERSIIGNVIAFPAASAESDSLTKLAITILIPGKAMTPGMIRISE